MYTAYLSAKPSDYSMEHCLRFTRCSLIMLEDYSIFGIFYTAASVVISLTAIFGNSVVIYALWFATSMRRTSKMSRILLLSLAASDFGVGLLVLPLNAALTVRMLRLVSRDGSVEDQHMTLTCSLIKTLMFFSILFGGASLLSVAAISIDRYLALKLHLRYPQLVTSWRVRIAVSAIWITSFLAALLETLIGFSDIINASAVVLVIVISSVAYWKVYRIAIHQQNLICVQDGQQNEICRLTQFARAKRLAMKTFYIYVIFVTCDAPSLFAFPIFVLSENPTSLLTLFYYFTGFLILFNSCLNPLVYCWKICEVRETVVYVLQRMFSKCILLGH